MKELPKIYQNKINKKINNNKKTCYLKDIDNIPTIMDKIDSLFDGYGHSYNIPVTIKTSNKVINTGIVSKTSDSILTIDNELIPINNIIDFKINDK